MYVNMCVSLIKKNKKKERKGKNLISKESIDINWTKWFDVTIFNRRFGFSELQKIISTILRR